MARPPEVKARKAPGVKRSSPDKVRTEVREAPGPEVVQMRIEVVENMRLDKAIKVKTMMTTTRMMTMRRRRRRMMAKKTMTILTRKYQQRLRVISVRTSITIW
jgi:hypothetical protein